MPGKPHSRLSALTVLFPTSDVSASTSTGHCSDSLSEKWCLFPIICPDSMCFTQTSPHHCSHVYMSASIMPTLLFFNCGIGSWALYSPLLFNYETIRSRNHDNWDQNCPSFHWITRQSVALSRWMGSPPNDMRFSESDCAVHTGWKDGMHCAHSKTITWGNHTSRPQLSLSGRLKFLLFHSVLFSFLL